MIYLVSICSQRLHEREFVSPICEIVRGAGFEFEVLRSGDDFGRICEKDSVIICGTGILDDLFLKESDRFSWIRDSGARVLGICGGMHLIGVLFGARVKEKTEIGFFREFFEKEFLGLKGEREVYHLHRLYADFSSLGCFERFTRGEVVQAVKHRELEIYGILFHPEVRCKEVVLNFLR